MRDSNELFELCKQLYDATGWDDTKDGFFDGGEIMPFTDRIGAYIGASNFRCPLYTSDYLLEKLPKKIGDVIAELSVVSEVNDDGDVVSWYANYDFYYLKNRGRKRTGESITTITKALTPYPSGKSPVEALLKLTLALHEEEIL